MPIEFEYTGDDDIEEDSEKEEMQEVEEIEFSITDDEINEWINELTRLKEEKEPINLQIDEELFLKINFEEEEI